MPQPGFAYISTHNPVGSRSGGGVGEGSGAGIALVELFGDVGLLEVVFLMVVLGAGEGAERLELLDTLFSSDLQLAFVVVEDGASILIADAHTDEIALSLGDIQQLFIRDDTRIEVDLDGFGMVSDASVGGVGRLPAAVADSSAKDAVETPKLGVGAPESAEGKSGGLILTGCGAVYRGGCRLPFGAELVRSGPCEGGQERRKNEESRGSLSFHKASNRGRC